MALETRVNYGQEILYVLHELWVAGGKDDLRPIPLNTFLEKFKPSNMKNAGPEQLKKYTWIFWQALVYRIAQKVVKTIHRENINIQIITGVHHSQPNATN